MQHLMLNSRYIAKLATRWTGLLFTILGLIGTFTSLEEFLDSSLSIWCRLGISVGILIGVWLFMFCACTIYVQKNRKTKVLTLNNGHHVYVQYGDVFSANEVDNPTEKRNIVIPVNRCFDTVVDNDLVSASSLHGIAMNKLYQENGYDPVSLGKKIQKNLKLQQISYENISIDEKRKGNLKRYPEGTVAEVKISEQCTYFFLGLSKFNKNLNASTSEEEYVLALMRLLKFCNDRSQEFPVIIPLIGAGLSRVKKSEQDILTYIISLIKMNKELVNFDLHIIVRKNGKDSVAIAQCKEE